MSSYDPRVIAQALEDLTGEMNRWSSVAGDMLALATETQRHAGEAISRAWHEAAITVDRAREDEESVQKTLSTVAAVLGNCTTATKNAHQTLKEARGILSKAEATLQKWQAELEKALAWLARAEARLAKAIAELERARAALRDAEWELSRAKDRYDACMRDQNRRNCNSEAAAVAKAAAEVVRAQQWVSAAKEEVRAAKEEVEMARARVACCTQAVKCSTQAVYLAQESVSAAAQAVNSAERSLDFARAAENFVGDAQKEMIVESEAAENMMLATRTAREFTDNAATHLRTADQAENAAQLYALSVRKELEYRIHWLYELNRPYGDNGRSISKEGTHGYPYQKARKEFMRSSLSDPNVGKHLKGWVTQEMNRVGKSGYWRSPVGYDVGHKKAGIDRPENFHWEYSSMNRSKGAKFKR
jgi:chromosome segregation ATPase